MESSATGKTDIGTLQIASDNKGIDIWSLVQEHSNYAHYRPLQVDDIEAAAIETRNKKKSYMLHNPCNNKYISVGEEEFFLWNLMDGQNTIMDLNLKYIDAFGKLGQNVVSEFLEILKNEGFLAGRSASVYEILQKCLLQGKPSSRMKQSFSFFTHSSFNIKKTDPYFSKIYQSFGFLFYKKPILIFNFIILAIDVFLFSYYLFVKHETMLLLSYAGSHDVIFFILASYLCVFIHENAHGLTVKHFGRRVRKGGFLIIYGNPIPYVDTSDIWMENRIPRIAVSFAGPFINGILGGIFLLATLPVPESLQDNILTHLGMLNSLQFIINLIPIIETDGHYIIQDWFEEPHLRRDALSFVKSGMWRKLIKWEKWQKKEFGFLLYGLIAVFGMVYMIYAGIHLWLYTIKHIVIAAIKRPFMVVEVLLVVIIITFFISILKFGLLKRKINLEKVLEKHLTIEGSI